MKYCSKCLQTDTRPNTVFGSDGICPACEYFSLLKYVNWQERFEIMHDIISSKPKKNGYNFDCIIGVSGGKDSTRQALWIRDKLRLNPLLVTLSYPPEQITKRGADNISNLINLGFDVIMSAPSPKVWKNLVKESFFKFTNWSKSTELALFSSVPQIAIRYNISTIFWGENPGLQLGDLNTLGRTGYDGNNLRYMNTLSGATNDWMLSCGLKKNQLLPYEYPSKKDFEKNNLNIIYLGWFLGDWSLQKNALYAITEGLKIREDTVANTGDWLGVTALDEDWVTLNQLIKYYKFGFGRVTDYMNEAIRSGSISRNDAIKNVEKYDSACSDKYINSFCEYIEISKEQFWTHVLKSVNKNLFSIDSNNKIIPKFKVGYGL